MRERWSRFVGWFERRLELGDFVRETLRHPVPPGVNWWYVFGSATLTFLAVQIVTGSLLAFFYVPSAQGAYASLQHLNHAVTLGWLLRALHNFSASGMVVMMCVHLAQVFLFGAFKYPRELTWLVGSLLFLITLLMAFSGQILRWDQSAYWGVNVLASMMGRLPVIGPSMVRLVLGGDYIGGATVSRFFGLHVFVVPAILLGLVGLHLYLVIRRGISEPPVAGEVVDEESYDAHYEELLSKGEPFYPRAFWKDGIFAALSVLTVLVIAAALGPTGPGAPPDASVLSAEPRPDWYFLPLFAALALAPPSWETAIMLGLPVALLLGLGVVPFIFRRGERAPSRRPVAVALVAITAVVLGLLTWIGSEAPWSPHMDAWTAAPVPVRYVRGRTALERQGAVVLQNKNCRNCHALGGEGGERGPALDGVAARLTRPELVRQVLQGGGNMPAYGQRLSPAEVSAVVAFMQTLDGDEARAPTSETHALGSDAVARGD